MTKKSTEQISAKEAAKRAGLSRRYFTVLLGEAGPDGTGSRVKGASRVQGDRPTWAITVPVGQAPEIDPPLRKRDMKPAEVF